jgi:WhiB family redox-sensing transcriptional regulator
MDTMDDTLEFDLLTAPILDERPWAVFAACKEEMSLTFFPQNRQEERTALTICSTCPVVDECLDHAIETNERFGVWGGTTERERRKLARRI